MEKIEVGKIMNIQCKIKEVLTNINSYIKKIKKNKSHKNKNRFINDQINVTNINECEKYKTALLFQMYTGKKLF